MTIHIEETLMNEYISVRTNSAKRAKVRNLLHRLKSYHLSTFAHSIRVGLKAYQIAKFVKEDPAPALDSWSHDIGKVEIPLRLLDFHGTELSTEDKNIMNTHPEKGERILRAEGLYWSAYLAKANHQFQKTNPYPPTKKEDFPFNYINKDESEKIIKSARQYVDFCSIADQADALSRPNGRHGSQPLTCELKLEKLCSNLPHVKDLIINLYNSGVILN